MSAPVGSRAMSPRCAPDPAGCVTMTGSMVATVTFRGQLQRAKGGGALLCLALSQRLSHEQHPFCKNSRRFTHPREVPGSRSRARAGGAAGRLVPLPEDQSH